MTSIHSSNNTVIALKLFGKYGGVNFVDVGNAAIMIASIITIVTFVAVAVIFVAVIDVVAVAAR